MGLVVGAGKDGVVYVLDQDTARFGQGSNFAVLKQQPIFYTYFPGWGIDASVVQNLDHLYDGKTHHLHAGSVFWQSPTHGPMLFCWGENEHLRAWTVDASGNLTFFAKSAETASAGAGGIGGMPGGILALSSNGGAAEHRDHLGSRTNLGRCKQVCRTRDLARLRRRESRSSAQYRRDATAPAALGQHPHPR